MDRSEDARGAHAANGESGRHGEIVDWVIVGGGPHGVCAARALVAAGASVRVVDPSGALLRRWVERVEPLAMTWMRSPVSHHLEAQPVSLHHFLHRPENADVADLAGFFRRPRHAAFLRHSLDVVARYRLDERLVAGRVESVLAEGSGLRVLGEEVDLRARRVLVATGANVPRVPAWARRLRAEGAAIHHVFGDEPALDTELVGGGISAVQRALMVHRATGRSVRLWMRRPVRIDEFDFDRDWAKHPFLAKWSKREDPERLRFLLRNRGEGSVPSGLAARLQRAVRRGSIEVEYGVPRVEWRGDRERLVVQGEGGATETEGITLVTGFVPETAPDWLRSTAEQLGLPLLHGLPRLDDEMQWGRGIHVSGPLARLRLGPMASNLVGARWATSMLPGVRMQAI
ncbi:MAG: FAD/NAD(P)-binding protein [Planctomycetota bacterium]